MQETTHKMDDKAKMTDLLTAEKFMTHVYNTFLCETVSSEVRGCMSSLLTEEHRMQEHIFSEMQTRNWYPVEKAEDAKVQAQKQKFRTAVTV
jgi:spore coat protein CotF